MNKDGAPTVMGLRPSAGTTSTGANVAEAGPAGRRRGILLVLSSPSGAGKSTLARQLIDEFDNLTLSVSSTTRAPRAGEVEGVHYRFVDSATFRAMIEGDELAEWAQVHGNFYGTPRRAVAEALSAGRDVVFDIDWQGARSLTKLWPEDVLRVFILPPSLTELAARLRKRATDAEAVIERRLARAKDEISHCDEYDYAIVNDDFARAYHTLKSVYLSRCANAGDAIHLDPAALAGVEACRLSSMGARVAALISS